MKIQICSVIGKRDYPINLIRVEKLSGTKSRVYRYLKKMLSNISININIKCIETETAR